MTEGKIASQTCRRSTHTEKGGRRRWAVKHQDWQKKRTYRGVMAPYFFGSGGLGGKAKNFSLLVSWPKKGNADVSEVRYSLGELVIVGESRQLRKPRKGVFPNKRHRLGKKRT